MSELPKGWAEAGIEDVAGYVSRGRSPKYAEKSDLPVINQKCVRWQGVDEKFVKFVDPSTWHQWAEERYVKFGDVLWNSTGRGTIGRAALFSGLSSYANAVVDSHVTIVRPSAAIDPRYLFNYIQSPFVQDKIEDMQSGSTNQVELNRAEILATVVPVAPLPEQRRIVTKVDGLTARTARARKELNRIPTLIARYKQRLLALAFSGELTVGWGAKQREVAKSVSLPRSLWQTPESWQWRRVDEIGAVGLGRQRSPKNHEGPDMRPYLRSANITWFGVDLSDVKKMNFDAKDFERFQLKYGDVLLNEGSGSAKEVGKPAIWRDEIPNCCFQNTILRVQPRDCTPEYLYWYFLLTALSEGFVDSTKGMNIQHISKDGLARYMIPVPSKFEQVEIVRRIESAFGWLDRVAADHAATAKLLPKLDAAILAKAFRGELVPQDPNDEPASVLLERIKGERIAVATGTARRFKTSGVSVDAPVASRTVRSKKESAMPKNRHDDDVWQKPYLAKFVKSERASNAQALFKLADLPVADFYKQLAWEIEQGHILDSLDVLRAA